MRVFLESLGCRLNQAEGEAILESFLKEGFTLSDGREVDVAIVNTCTVTSKAEQKARGDIRRLSSKSHLVIVTGCYAELEEVEIRSLGDNVIVVPNSKKGTLPALARRLSLVIPNKDNLNELLRVISEEGEGPFAFDPATFTHHSRAYLKIEDGCDNDCGYCRTKIARGPAVSLDPALVVERAKRLEERGYREITLTGVNLTAWRWEGESLGGLLSKLSKALGEDVRIRLSSLEPAGVDVALLEAVKDERVNPYFHIPIQSASPNVMKRIGRGYTFSHLERVVRALRESKDDPFISCDLIAGLPGEEGEDHRATYDFMKEHGFSSMHVFPYSPRKGTPLYRAAHPAEGVRDERAQELRELSKELYNSYLERQQGKRLEFILEENRRATTTNYIKCSVNSKNPLEVRGLYSGILTSISPPLLSL